MIASLRSVAPLLISTLFLLMGSSLVHTLIALRGGELGFSLTSIGALTSAYYLGFLIGTHLVPRLTHLIGHIRAFAFCAVVVAMLSLAQAIYPAYWLWYLTRVMQGLLLVGLYAIIESWLNGASAPEQRSFVFSVYMMTSLGAGALAQQWLRLDGQAFVLFSVAVLLFCAAALPVLATPQAEPVMQAVPKVQLLRFFRMVPIALVCSCVSGLVLGALWGLLPLYAEARGFSRQDIGTYVSLVVAGGMVLQWPLGHLADRVDRRLALALISTVMALVAAAILLLPWLDLPQALALAFVFGGASFALYPIAVAHLVDYVEPGELLSASSTVLLLHGLGSAVGPTAAGALMSRGQPGLLFAWFAGLGVLLAVYAIYRYTRGELEVTSEDNFAPMVHSSDKSLELHPKAEEPPVPGAGAISEPDPDRFQL